MAKWYATVPVRHASNDYPEAGFDRLFRALDLEGMKDIAIDGDISHGVSQVRFGFEADNSEAATEIAINMTKALIRRIAQTDVMSVIPVVVEVEELGPLEDWDGRYRQLMDLARELAEKHGVADSISITEVAEQVLGLWGQPTGDQRANLIHLILQAARSQEAQSRSPR